MSNAFNDFLSSFGEGLAGAGGPNMRGYDHATELYVNNNHARAPKFNHLYFVSFNINDNVIRDPIWAGSGSREVGLLVKGTSLPKFKISTDLMNQYNRKTQVQTKLTYEPVTMEFHDDNSEITNGLWKNYYRYYYVDSIYGGKNDNEEPVKKSKTSIVTKLFGGIFNPGGKRIKGRETSIVPAGYGTKEKHDQDIRNRSPYGLDNGQDVPFFKSIDIFVLHQQRFTQYTLVNPKITNWEHDEVNQSDNTKFMRNKMTLVYETVFYNDGKIGKGSNSGVFAEALYDKTPSPLSVAGKGSLSLLGPGGTIAGITDVFGEGGSLEQGNYWEAALQSATIYKNYNQISTEQATKESFGMLDTGLGIVTGSKWGEINDNLSDHFTNGIGVYTNQYSKNNLEDAPNSMRVTDEMLRAGYLSKEEKDAAAAAAAAPAAAALPEDATVTQAPNSGTLPNVDGTPTISQIDRTATIKRVDGELESLSKVDSSVGETVNAAINTITATRLVTPTEADLNNPQYIIQSDQYFSAITSLPSGPELDSRAYDYAKDQLTNLKTVGDTVINSAADIVRSGTLVRNQITDSIASLNDNKIKLNDPTISPEAAAKISNDNQRWQIATAGLGSNSDKLTNQLQDLSANARDLGSTIKAQASLSKVLVDSNQELYLSVQKLSSSGVAYRALVLEGTTAQKTTTDLDRLYWKYGNGSDYQTFEQFSARYDSATPPETAKEAWANIISTGKANYQFAVDRANSDMTDTHSKLIEITNRKSITVQEITNNSKILDTSVITTSGNGTVEAIKIYQAFNSVNTAKGSFYQDGIPVVVIKQNNVELYRPAQVETLVTALTPAEQKQFIESGGKFSNPLIAQSIRAAPGLPIAEYVRLMTAQFPNLKATDAQIIIYTKKK